MPLKYESEHGEIQIYRDKTGDRMNQQAKTPPSPKTPTYTTEQLPINEAATLYKGLYRPTPIRKFRKEEPGTYMATKYLLADVDYVSAETVEVRENGFGHLGVLLAVAQPDQSITISTWMVDRRLAIETNISANLVEPRVKFKTEGYTCDDQFDVGVLVHEEHQALDTIMYECSRLITCSRRGITYLLTHKARGANSIIARLSNALKVEIADMGRGNGGFRIIKMIRTSDTKQLGIPLSRFEYTTADGQTIQFETSPSLFSTEKVDVGSDFLIRSILAEERSRSPLKIYDMACGYGAIGLSLAANLPNSRVKLSDADARAVDLANINIKNLALGNRASVSTANGPIYTTEEFDLVVSNPPLHTERPMLIDMIAKARRLVRKGGKMILIVEDSRVSEIKELLDPIIGSVQERDSIPSHKLLEIAK